MRVEIHPNLKQSKLLTCFMVTISVRGWWIFGKRSLLYKQGNRWKEYLGATPLYLSVQRGLPDGNKARH